MSAIISFFEDDGGITEPIALELSLSGDLSGELGAEYVTAPIALELKLSGDLAGAVQRQTSINLNLKLSGDLTGSVRLAIVQPPPVLEEIDADAFTKQFYTARLLGNNVRIPITSATLETPKGSIATRVSCQIARADLSLVTKAKTYKFQVGTRETYNGAIEWETILDNAELDSRNYSAAWAANQPSDSLSFSVIAPLSDRLNRFPVSNFIFYNPAKTDVSLDESERIKIEGGGVINNELTRVSGLTLYDVLTHVRKRIGFQNVVTNIPNHEIIRADFSFTQSWNDSLKSLLGAFETIPRLKVGNVLEFFDKTQPIDDDFEPEILHIRHRRDLSLSIPSGGAIDGYVVSYAVSNSNADYYVDRTIETTDETGIYGQSNFTRTEITRTFRDWKNLSDTDNVLRSDLISERHSTYNNTLSLIGRETNTLSYDAQGKRTASLRTIESRVPNLESGGTPALLTTRTETQTISYLTDAQNPRRQIQDKIITQIRGLVAVDAENPYFDEDFKQDISDANRAGNLTAAMTSEFAPIKTTTETLTPLGNNQFEVRVSTVDHLRNTTTSGTSEPKTGDASLSSTGGKTKQIVILRDGISYPTGKPILPFSIGQLPLSLGIPHAQRSLKRKVDGMQEGTASAIGYSSSVKPGVYFRIFDRENNNLGRYIIEGVKAQFDNLGAQNQTVFTTIEISQV